MSIWNEYNTYNDGSFIKTWKFLPWTHEIPPKGGIPPRLGTTALEDKHIICCLGHNFQTANARRPTKSSKDAGVHLVFKKETKGSLLRLGPKAWWSTPKKPKPTPNMSSPTKALKSKTSHSF